MRCTYGPMALFSAGGPGRPDVIIESGTGGIFSAELNGPALPIFDFNDQPILSISSSAAGQAQWRVDDYLAGWVRFGTLSVRVMSNDAGDLLQNTAAAVAAAQQAAATAQQAYQDLQAALQSGTGGGGGLPAGTTLEDIPNGLTRLAFSQAERDKLGQVAAGATALKVGPAATDAKPGNYAPAISDIGGVRNVAGFGRVWGRTAAQGVPTVADGLLDGDYIFVTRS